VIPTIYIYIRLGCGSSLSIINVNCASLRHCLMLLSFCWFLLYQYIRESFSLVYASARRQFGDKSAKWEDQAWGTSKLHAYWVHIELAFSRYTKIFQQYHNFTHFIMTCLRMISQKSFRHPKKIRSIITTYYTKAQWCFYVIFYKNQKNCMYMYLCCVNSPTSSFPFLYGKYLAKEY
jgi:hypothetical protein